MIFKGNGIVWDTEFQKELCKFQNGIYETKDFRTASILAKLEYEYNSNDLKALEQKELKAQEIETQEIKKPKK